MLETRQVCPPSMYYIVCILPLVAWSAFRILQSVGKIVVSWDLFRLLFSSKSRGGCCAERLEQGRNEARTRRNECGKNQSKIPSMYAGHVSGRPPP